MLSLRDVELSNTQAKLLVYAKEQRTLREGELQTQLDLERERAAVAQAKHSTTLRALDAAEAKVAELSVGSGRLTQREGDLSVLLQQEREKAMVSAAKFNTLKSKTDKEIVELKQRLQGYEGGSAAAAAATVALGKPSRYVEC